MPSATYSNLVQAVSAYIPREKATGIVDRQLPKCNTTADALDQAALRSMIAWILGAANLYIPEPARRKELEAKITEMSKS